jgi:hypothetical protein
MLVYKIKSFQLCLSFSVIINSGCRNYLQAVTELSKCSHHKNTLDAMKPAACKGQARSV